MAITDGRLRTKDEDLYMKFEPDKLEWTRSPKSYKIAEDSYLHMVVENKRIIWYNKYKSRVAYLLAI